MKKLLVLIALSGITALAACKTSTGGGGGGSGGYGGGSGGYGGGSGGSGTCFDIGDPCAFSDECCGGFCSQAQQCE